MSELLIAVEPIVLVAVAAIAAALCSAWGNAMIYAAQMITQAAKDETLADGPAKMAWVVAQVRAYLPTFAAAVMTDKKIQSACQSLYDTIKSFAKAYLAQKLGSNTVETSNNAALMGEVHAGE